MRSVMLPMLGLVAGWFHHLRRWIEGITALVTGWDRFQLILVVDPRARRDVMSGFKKMIIPGYSAGRMTGRNLGAKVSAASRRSFS